MSKKSTPIPVRFSAKGAAEIKRVSRRIALSQQDTIRMAVERGLPVLLSVFSTPSVAAK